MLLVKVDMVVLRVINIDSNPHEIFDVLRTDGIVKEIVNNLGEERFISYV